MSQANTTTRRIINPFVGFMVVLSAVLVAFIGAISVDAAEVSSQNITLTPAATDIALNPGQSYSGSAKVLNQGTEAFDVSLSVTPYHVQNGSYIPEFTQLEGTTSADKWVKVDQATASNLQPNKSFEVNYTVHVPANTAPGGYYAVLFAQSTPSVTTDGGVVQHNKVGNILYITVKGDVKTAGEAVAGNIPLFSGNGKITAPVTVKNTGGVHFKSTYNVTIKSLIGGGEVFKDSRQYYVLPQTQRDVSMEWKTSTWFGLYSVSRSVQLPGSTTELPDKTVIVVNPWLAVIVLLALALITSSFFIKGKNRKTRHRR